MKTYAIISDIHGNSLALQAVLNDISTRSIDTIINLGDHVFGALEPEVTAGILGQHPMLCISGNTDREILESFEKPSAKENMDRVKSLLSNQTLDWLKGLPKTATCDGVFFVCHGTPESDDAYLLEEVTAQGVFVYNDDVLVEKTKHIQERIILCGHSHVNRVIYLSNGKIILNPGSVGLPAYLGTGEHRFAMESMTPHAKYAIVQVDGESMNIEQVHCTYNWQQASASAKANGSEKWSQFLLHGRMPKDLRV
ncbi:metallophosphoesterase family protein [Mucilaginibacter sp. Bleaf8]|uniref:metallophosphoesterase family protein n=1 Tax=Mucilaginibacter sp. Bleaf8 TaxID=2834430 RepID=UPI001BD0F1A6|nr:metallophosphoesterase family protein [Mucilaginibacter sp. Bleaf8]MBS7566135.1 metallophosphoesterase family protein [Mucilaginibacter sp. Bleaf8]